MSEPPSLSEAACAVLAAAAPDDKVALSARFAAAWRDGSISTIGDAAPQDRPARPAKPILQSPRDMPRRRAGGSDAGRIALLHAIAHIELNAIDLAWDLIARFTAQELPRAFYDDWVGVAAEEATHHAMIARRLGDFGAAYGDLPAHDGLWQAAQATAGDFLARLAVVPLVLEARGLDVTPEMSARLTRFGDEESAALLDHLYTQEIGHVAAGRRWFEWGCARASLAPVETYHRLVRQYHGGTLKPPFNRQARDAAGFGAAFYEGMIAG